MERNKQKMPHGSEPNMWLNSLIAGGVGLGLIILSALLMPVLLLGLSDPNGFVMPAAGICVFIGGAASGIIAAKTSKGKELTASGISSAVILVPMLLISFMFKKGFDLFGFIIIAAVLAASALLGGFAVSKITQNKKHSMKKVMKRR